MPPASVDRALRAGGLKEGVAWSTQQVSLPIGQPPQLAPPVCGAPFQCNGLTELANLVLSDVETGAVKPTGAVEEARLLMQFTIPPVFVPPNAPSGGRLRSGR